MTNEELTAEVATLKKQLRRTWVGAFALLWLTFFMFWSPFRLGLASFGAVNFKTVRAERFEMVDDSGKQRGFLQAGEGQPQFHLLNDRGLPGFSLVTSNDATRLNIWSGATALSLAVPPSEADTAELTVSDVPSKTGTSVTFHPNKLPDVRLTTGPGDPRVAYPR